MSAQYYMYSNVHTVVSVQKYLYSVVYRVGDWTPPLLQIEYLTDIILESPNTYVHG